MLKLDFMTIVMVLRRIELIIMDFGDGMQKILNRIFLYGNFGFYLLWLFLHLVVSIWYFVLGIAPVLESFLVSSGVLKSYKALNIDKVRHLAVVVDSEDARQTSKVLELLRWLASVGVKSICLYDKEGELKKSKEAIMEGLNWGTLSEDASLAYPLSQCNHINLEFASLADGKYAMARAANLLFSQHYGTTNPGKPNITESHISEALRAVGCGGPDPDLLLIYGPARCHLGFPAWRMRYTEIVHMGPLKSMKFGSLVKAVYKFATVHQNYGK